MPLALPISKIASPPTCSSPHAKANPDAQQSGSCAPSVSSNDILRGQKTVEISHNGLTYRLQATRLGKLILTK